MSGHSKWATTKHKKAAIDAKRGKLFAKLIKNIEIAARLGGGDPDGNPSLYDAIYKAKKASMPADNIARAVKRGAGAEDGAANYEDIVYEGYAPAGVGLIIECLTDNRNRAAAEVRSTLTKGNGSLATSGSVSFNFERKGQIVVPSEGVDFDKLFETAAEAGAEDVTDDGEVFTVVTGPSDLFTVRKALQEAGFDYDSADQVMQPKNEVELSLDDARKVSKLIDNLDDLDDVQNIYSNWTASDEVMAQLDRSNPRDYPWRRPRAHTLRGRRDRSRRAPPAFVYSRGRGAVLTGYHPGSASTGHLQRPVRENGPIRAGRGIYRACVRPIQPQHRTRYRTGRRPRHARRRATQYSRGVAYAYRSQAGYHR